MPQVSELAFLRFRELSVRVGGVTEESVEQLCREHPEESIGLRVLFDDYSRLEEMFHFSPDTILEELKVAREAEIKGVGETEGRTLFGVEEMLIGRLRADVFQPDERYTNADAIGMGGGGTVYKAWDEQLQRHLALKVCRRPTDPSSVAQAISRFLDEAQIMGQLDHPGIIPVHDLGLDADGQLFYAMRLVEGWDLHEVIGWVHGVSPAPESENWNMLGIVGALQKVCEVMAYVHSKRVLHRDLKPSNVMIGRFGQVQVVDWGTAKLIGKPERRDLRLRVERSDSISIHTNRKAAGQDGDEHSPMTTMDGTRIGTPAYMSPEQANGFIEELDERSDIYSVGALLYHALCGHPPYAGGGRKMGVWALLRLVTEGPPDPVSKEKRGVPLELQAICEKAMARAPEDRYSEMGAMAHDLRAYLEGTRVRALKGSYWLKLRKWSKRHPLSVAACAIVVALLVVFVRFEGERRTLAAEMLVQETLTSMRPSLKAHARRGRDLWPVENSKVEAMQMWLQEAERYAQDRTKAEQSPSALQQSLANLINDLGPPATLVSEVKVRRERALESKLHTLDSQHASDAWARAIEEVAQDDRYHGLQLRPQEGLLPLGPDPNSGLQEFAHYLSGILPDAREDDEMFMSPETCIIFVLVPETTLLVGAQRVSPARPNYYRFTDPHDGPVREALVPAFYLSKFELTQGQWRRLTGGNSAIFRSDRGYPEFGLDPGDITESHPAESISWADVMSFFPRWSLELPSEDQWEVACRSGENSLLDSLTASAPISEFANAIDLSFAMVEEMDPPPVEFDDRYSIHAPVGHYMANEWGFHDMLGNVMEWCVPRPEGAALLGMRGGGFDSWPEDCNATSRELRRPDYRGHSAGARPAMRALLR